MKHFQFKKIDDVKPEELVGNINLALHHHMAPPGDDCVEGDEKVIEKKDQDELEAVIK